MHSVPIHERYRLIKGLRKTGHVIQSPQSGLFAKFDIVILLYGVGFNSITSCFAYF